MNILKKSNIADGLNEKLSNYSYVGRFSEDGIAHATLAKENVSCLINIEGDVVYKNDCIYKSKTVFSEGLSIVSVDGFKYGVINQKGEYVILPEYDDIMSFENGLAMVRKDNYSGVVNKDGEVVLPLNRKLDKIDSASGIISVQYPDDYSLLSPCSPGFIDLNGDEVKFNRIRGVINQEFIDPPKSISSVNQIIPNSNEWYVIDGKCKFDWSIKEYRRPYIFKIEKNLIIKFTPSSLTKISENEYMYIRFGGKEDDYIRFYVMSSTRGVICSIKKGTLYGTMRNGFIVLSNPRYREGKRVFDEYALNYNGDRITVDTYDSIEPIKLNRKYEANLAICTKNKYVGLLNSNGVELIKPIYKSVRVIYYNLAICKDKDGLDIVVQF